MPWDDLHGEVLGEFASLYDQAEAEGQMRLALLFKAREAAHWAARAERAVWRRAYYQEHRAEEAAAAHTRYLAIRNTEAYRKANRLKSAAYYRRHRDAVCAKRREKHHSAKARAVELARQAEQSAAA